MCDNIFGVFWIVTFSPSFRPSWSYLHVSPLKSEWKSAWNTLEDPVGCHICCRLASKSGKIMITCMKTTWTFSETWIWILHTPCPQNTCAASITLSFAVDWRHGPLTRYVKLRVAHSPAMHTMVCYERSFSEFYLSIWNQLVFNQRLQLFVQSPQQYLLIFAWRN